MRTRIYVAGPYTSDPQGNTERAIDIGQELLDRGYAPMVPHLTHYWHARHANDWQAWMDLDLPWVAAADAVLRLPGQSDGADMEVRTAHRLGIRVFYSVEDLAAAVPSQRAEAPEPVQRAMAAIAATFRRKNADYAEDSDWQSNFRDVAQQMGIDPVDACDTLVAVKQARLKSLRANGRGPENEAVEDTYLDRAVYSVIALAMAAFS